ncbi:MAG TPA: polyisoprenoid-binding protein [Oxalobacteraceae bacterium]|nr:polyisoprenoid-binding protein [Oxalobacteraceae bacterium]
MSLRKIIHTGGTALLCLALSGLAYAALKVDTAKSSVSAVSKQMGVPVEGKFKKFNAQIDFNAAKPEASKANVDIDVASFDLGSAEFNSEVMKKEWFNAAQFPKATFVSTGIKPAAGGKYDVAGKLTVKGKTADVVFPLTVKKEGAAQVFEGTLPIKRLAHNIGEGEWKDTSMVADEVVIKFRVVTAQ